MLPFSRMTRHLCLALAALALSACTSKNIKPDYQIPPGSRMGVLSVGITAQDEMPQFVWHFRRVGQTEAKEIAFHTVYDPLVWSNPRGRLVNLELPEGDYEFFDWTSFLTSPTAYFRIPFSIKAGRVTYYGRLHLHMRAFNYVVETSNHYAEDMALLRQQMPKLDTSTIDQGEFAFYHCEDASCVKRSAGRTMIIPIILPPMRR